MDESKVALIRAFAFDDPSLSEDQRSYVLTQTKEDHTWFALHNYLRMHRLAEMAQEKEAAEARSTNSSAPEGETS